MTNAARMAVFLLPAVLVAGCGAGRPQPPESLCGVRTPASAITPLLPDEGERVAQKRTKVPSAENACEVSVDDRFYFQVRHDPDGRNYSMPAGSFPPAEPRTFQGQLGAGELQAQAIATCRGGKKVFAAITLNIDDHDELYPDTPPDLEKFLNAYVPAVQKHYGCKG